METTNIIIRGIWIDEVDEMIDTLGDDFGLLADEIKSGEIV